MLPQLWGRKINPTHCCLTVITGKLWLARILFYRATFSELDRDGPKQPNVLCKTTFLCVSCEFGEAIGGILRPNARWNCPTRENMLLISINKPPPHRAPLVAQQTPYFSRGFSLHSWDSQGHPWTRRFVKAAAPLQPCNKRNHERSRQSCVREFRPIFCHSHSFETSKFRQ